MIALNRRRIFVGESEIDYSKMYLTLEALEDGTFAFSKAYSYSTDRGRTWTSASAGESTPTVQEGQEICFKATNSPASGSGVGTFSSTGTYNAKGNPLSMRNGDNFKTSTSRGNYIFQNMFRNSTGLVDASNIIIPSSFGYTYFCYYMFAGCTSLVAVPVLPAKTLAHSCYRNMFDGCSSLETAPVLPALSLYTGCYIQMFRNCSKLKYIKALYTTVYNTNHTSNWVSGVAASGTFVKNAQQSSTTRGVSGIPSGWTIENDPSTVT